MNTFTAGFLELSPRLGLTLMHSLWQGGVIAIALVALLRRQTASTLRYGTCCCAMFAFVIWVAATFSMVSVSSSEPIAIWRVTQVHPAMTPVIDMPIAPSEPMPASRLALDMNQLAGTAWLAGAFTVALWHLAGWFWVRRLVHLGRMLESQAIIETLAASLGIHRIVRLMESGVMTVPAVIGVFRPVILLPIGLLCDLSPEQIEAILIHELAHIRRHDYVVNLLQVVVESLLFYHPATWWISSQIRREREHCCDDIAAPRFAPTQYASALLALEERRWPIPHAMVAANGGSLLERVQRLLGRVGSPKPRPIQSAIGAIIALACIVVPVAIIGCDKPKSSSTVQANPPASANAETELDIPYLSPIEEDDLNPISDFERICAGDLLEITINDLTAIGVPTKEKFKVGDPDGTVSLPLVQQGIKVSGMSNAEAQRAISKAYREAQIIPDAVVKVFRLYSVKLSYSALGSFDKPGVYAIQTPEDRLTTALAIAGAQLGGQKYIYVFRQDKHSSHRSLKIPVAQLMSGDPKFNLVMRPDDIVTVPAVNHPPAAVSPSKPATSTSGGDEYYVGGTNIKRVGVYTLPAAKITLKQAIIAAGGMDGGYISVFRRQAGKVLLVIDNAKYGDLVSGAVNDIYLHASDTVMMNATAQKWPPAATQQTPAP